MSDQKRPSDSKGDRVRESQQLQRKPIAMIYASDRNIEDVADEVWAAFEAYKKDAQ